MKKIAFLLPVLFFLGLANLKANSIKKHQITMQEAPPKKVKYALVISFISMGGGVDGASYEKINQYIKNHPKKPAVVLSRMGREGESTMYLKLSELSKKEKKVFIEEIEKLIVNKELVKIQKDVTI